MSRTALYRFYDAHGDLLYVGISVTPWARWKQHKSEKDWAEDVATSAMEWFDTRAEALAAEKAAIVAEEPRYNIQHNRLPTKISTEVPRLVIACSGCGQPVGDGGIVECDWLLAIERHQATRQQMADTSWEPIDIAALLAENQQPVPWRAWHPECDPDPSADSYWIAAERLRTLADVFDWIAHLAEKDWVGATDWLSVVRGISHGSGILQLEERHLGVRSA